MATYHTYPQTALSTRKVSHQIHTYIYLEYKQSNKLIITKICC